MKNKKSQKADKDKSSAKAKSIFRKESRLQKLTQSMMEAQKGMLDIATELSELRGLPEAIQKKFDKQQAKNDGKVNEKAQPLLTMSQWKELLESSKKASSLPPTPANAGLFTSACEKAKAAPRQVLQLASPATAASTNMTSSVSTTRTDVIAALKSNLTIADN